MQSILQLASAKALLGYPGSVRKAYNVDLNPRTGETLTLTQRTNRKGDTTYQLYSPLHGPVLAICIQDHWNKQFYSE